MKRADGAPAWEYHMVRWLERQGYDATYCSSCGRYLPMTCAQCGNEIDLISAHFCAACGDALVAA